MSHFDVELDVRQLACPLPILRAKKSLFSMNSDAILKVLATDKEAPADFEVFCRQTGNQLLSSELNGDEFIFYIRRR